MWKNRDNYVKETTYTNGGLEIDSIIQLFYFISLENHCAIISTVSIAVLLKDLYSSKNGNKICSSWRVIRGGRGLMPVHYPLGWSNVQFLERIGVLDHRERLQVRSAIIARSKMFRFVSFS